MNNSRDERWQQALSHLETQLIHAEAERDALGKQLVAAREALSEVRYEDFYGDCIYCQQRVDRDGHEPECRYLAIAAAQDAPGEE